MIDDEDALDLFRDQIKIKDQEIERLGEKNAELWMEICMVRSALQNEIDRLRQNAKQDAQYLLAYHRICQKHGIAPSSSELIAATKENKDV